MLAAGAEHAREVRLGPARGHFLAGTGIQQVVVDLGGIEPAARDHLAQRSRIAQRGDAEEVEQALVAQALESLGDAVRAQHLPHADGALGGLGPDRVVQLEQIDRVALQALQALLQARLDLAGEIGAAEIEPDLGREIRLGVDLLQQPAERLLRLAVAVGGCGVDPVHAAIEPAPQRRELGVVVGMDQDAADEAAAEHQLGDLKAGTAERSIAHVPSLGCSPSRWRASCRSGERQHDVGTGTARAPAGVRTRPRSRQAWGARSRAGSSDSTPRRPGCRRC